MLCIVVFVDDSDVTVRVFSCKGPAAPSVALTQSCFQTLDLNMDFKCFTPPSVGCGDVTISDAFEICAHRDPFSSLKLSGNKLRNIFNKEFRKAHLLLLMRTHSISRNHTNNLFPLVQDSVEKLI